jgi:hypothetical protein
MDILGDVGEQECREEESGAGVSWMFQKTLFQLTIPG